MRINKLAIGFLSLSTAFLLTMSCVMDNMIAAETQTGTVQEQKDDTEDLNNPELASSLELFQFMNKAREDAGITPLEWDANLYAVACLRSQEASVCWSHTRPDSTIFATAFIGGPWKEMGENLSRVNRIDAQFAFDGLMGSPSHKDNILYAPWKYAAVAAYWCNGECFYATEFGY